MSYAVLRACSICLLDKRYWFTFAIGRSCRFKTWLDKLLWDPVDKNIFRMKGVLHVLGSRCIHVLQAVHDLYEIVAGPEWSGDEAPLTRVVVIGKHLDYDSLHASLLECTVAQ